LGINFAYLNGVVRRGSEPPKNIRLMFLGKITVKFVLGQKIVFVNQKENIFRVEEGFW
jgi:hypothetical protein